MKERHLRTSINQRKTSTLNRPSCRRYAVLISRVLHPISGKPHPFFTTLGKLSSCMLCLAYFFLGFLICINLRRVCFWQLLLVLKRQMPTLECLRVPRDISVCFLILGTRGSSEKRSKYSSILVMLMTSEQSCYSVLRSHTPVSQRCDRDKQHRDTTDNTQGQ